MQVGKVTRHKKGQNLAPAVLKDFVSAGPSIDNEINGFGSSPSRMMSLPRKRD
jgi:hypothetical protein